LIQDALYWLAWNARQRQATCGSSNQASEEDSEYDLEPSTSGGNPSCQPGIFDKGSHL